MSSLKTCVVCLALTGGLACAATSFNVYGTGFTNTGTQVAAGGKDGNWSIISAPAGEGLTTPFDPFVTETNSSPFGDTPPWVADSLTSEWISPQQTENTSDANSSTVAYVYQETFTIGAGLNPSTAVITGNWTADNYGEILLNGVQVDPGAAIASGTLGAFQAFIAFTIDTATGATFQTGSNTLTFEVFNNANGAPDVTGLNVQITSATANSATPEPGSMVLVALGLGMLGWAGRRRRA